MDSVHCAVAPGPDAYHVDELRPVLTGHSGVGPGISGEWPGLSAPPGTASAPAGHPHLSRSRQPSITAPPVDMQMMSERFTEHRALQALIQAPRFPAVRCYVAERFEGRQFARPCLPIGAALPLGSTHPSWS